MVKRRLSQTLGQLKKGYPLDTFEGGFPTVQVANAPGAVGTRDILSGGVLASGVETVITEGFSNPDIYRNLKYIPSAPSMVGLNITVKGTDWADRVVEEVVEITGPEDFGRQPFKTLISITVPPRVEVGDEISIAYGPAFGLYRPLVASGLDLLVVDGTPSGVTEVDLEYSTYTPTEAPDYVNVYMAYYLTDTF